METLRWIRVPGDTIFAVGELTMVWFVLTPRRKPSEEILGAVEPAMSD